MPSNRKTRTAERPARVPPGHKLVAAGLDEGPGPSPRRLWWVYVLGALAATFLAFETYGPALHGPFLFDDEYLPFLIPELQTAPLRAWLGVRPFLMVSYWLNYQSTGVAPYPYHAVNVTFHALNTLLVWLIVRKLLVRVGEEGTRRDILSGFAAGLFLLHPVQTESVAYVASRSETMSIFFFLAAWVAFLYRKGDALGWVRTAVVLILFGIACTVKEHTTVLPAILLLTDYFFTTPFRLEGIRRNLRLYLPVVILGALGGVAVWRVLSTATSAGFKLREFTWYQYLFTQFRVVWTYLRLYVLPVAQNGDYQYPVSHDILEHGAIFGLIGLLAVTVAAWRYRKLFPLAAFGWFGFLILLAPTSSVVPIRDVIAERRLYLPFVCLLLITVDFLRRWRTGPVLMAGALSLILVVSGFAAWNRNHVWSSPISFWSDTVRKSPGNGRAWFQLAYAQWQTGQCQSAVTNYEKVEKLEEPDWRLLIDWALALDCLGRTDDAVAKLRQATSIAPSALTWSQIGMLYGKSGRNAEALQALETAEKFDSRFEMTFVYRANVYAAGGDLATAVKWYRHAVSINPNNEHARNALAIAEQRLAGR